MRFFQVVLSSAAFAAFVAALEINQFPSGGVVAGTTYTITYSPADDVPTTFILRQGKSTDLDTIGTLTTSATGGKFEWTPSKDLPNEADYALEIKRGDTVNYSAQFPLTGGSGSKPAPSNSVQPSNSPSPSSAPSPSASASGSSSSLITSTSASPSVAPSPSSAPASNSTVSSATLSRTSASRTPTGTATVPEVTGNAANSLFANPMAAVAGAAAAFAYLV